MCLCLAPLEVTVVVAAVSRAQPLPIPLHRCVPIAPPPCASPCRRSLSALLRTAPLTVKKMATTRLAPVDVFRAASCGAMQCTLRCRSPPITVGPVAHSSMPYSTMTRSRPTKGAGTRMSRARSRAAAHARAM